MKATPRNMKNQILLVSDDTNTKDRRILHCPDCDLEFSGNKGDYWNLPENEVLHCICGEELELVTKITPVKYIQ